MKNWTFISKSRIIIAGIISLILVFYFFNFVPRNINIIASRNLGRQLFAYALNFIIFFIVIYLVSCLLAYLYQKLFKRERQTFFEITFTHTKTRHWLISFLLMHGVQESNLRQNFWRVLYCHYTNPAFVPIAIGTSAGDARR